jgi:Phospholipid methyltransferase
MLPAPLDVIIPALLVAVGQTLVLSSTWQLGITGTFLGDYFGILMDEVGVSILCHNCRTDATGGHFPVHPASGSFPIQLF